mmetsp:Transcript_9335/g.34829  ORF Transcript_9335/g.34829 Transcript_9335/m.34829 type:complete len:207 (+) Transcript_9335:3027-3647(+)
MSIFFYASSTWYVLPISCSVRSVAFPAFWRHPSTAPRTACLAFPSEHAARSAVALNSTRRLAALASVRRSSGISRISSALSTEKEKAKSSEKISTNRSKTIDAACTAFTAVTFATSRFRCPLRAARRSVSCTKRSIEPTCFSHATLTSHAAWRRHSIPEFTSSIDSKSWSRTRSEPLFSFPRVPQSAACASPARNARAILPNASLD